MAKRKKGKAPIRDRSPVPPPTVAFKDRKKEAKKTACRGKAVSDEEGP